MKRIYITNGTPFSGKSTWALRNFAPEYIIESDVHKYDKERNGDLTQYLCYFATFNCEKDCVIVQTNNSLQNFKRYKEILDGLHEHLIDPSYELIIVNFELSMDEIKANRAESNRYKRDFKKQDRLEWYYKIWLNSLEQIKQCDLWSCVTVKREPNTMESFLE
jgi:hypothetical protein